MGQTTALQEPGPVLLACGHRVLFRPSHRPPYGHLAWCQQCGAYSHQPFPMPRNSAGEPVPGEWRWRCATGNRCNGGQHDHGSSETNARYAGSRHSRAHPKHEVWLISPYGVVTERWGDALGTETMPLFNTYGIAYWKGREDGGKAQEGIHRQAASGRESPGTGTVGTISGSLRTESTG